MNVPVISVVMSAYNDQAFVGEAVESILNQTFTDFEFIIVDDGSTDRTGEILSVYAAHNDRIVFIRNEQNMGVVGALNRGLERVRGEYIARQDADDLAAPHRLAQQIAFLQAHPQIGAVGTQALYIDPSGTPLGPCLQPIYIQNQDLQKRLLVYNCFCGPSVLVRRACWQAAGFYFSEGLDASEDYDLCLRLAEVTQLANLDNPLYLYRQHPNSASHRRQYTQARNKAIGLERALRRRYGPAPERARLLGVASDYLRAAIIGFAANKTDPAREDLGHALSLYPSLLATDEPLVGLLTNYMPGQPTEAQLAFIQSIFAELLPRTLFLARVRSRLLSRLHMSEVFARVAQNDFGSTDGHLWLGLRYDPTWLFKRGVLSVLLKSFLSRDSAQPH